MSFEIIKNRLEELKVSNSDFAYNGFDKTDEILGPWTEVAQKGGEDEGSEWYSVKYFSKYNVFVRIDGYYSSYIGTDFEDEPYEVKPVEKTVTVYE